MSQPANRRVVELLKSGNREGCAKLVDMYQDRLQGEAVHLFRLAPEDAEEVVSDTMMAVITQVHSFEFRNTDGDFHYWVMTIFRNKVRDYVRRRTLTEGLVVSFQESMLDHREEYSEAEGEVVAEIVRQYEEMVRGGEEEKRPEGKGSRLVVIAETLDAMESWERVLLRCRALDVPYEDIARYTGKPAKNLKVYHPRVRKKFIKMLSVHYPEVSAR